MMLERTRHARLSLQTWSSPRHHSLVYNASELQYDDDSHNFPRQQLLTEKAQPLIKSVAVSENNAELPATALETLSIVPLGPAASWKQPELHGAQSAEGLSSRSLLAQSDIYEPATSGKSICFTCVQASDRVFSIFVS